MPALIHSTEVDMSTYKAKVAAWPPASKQPVKIRDKKKHTRRVATLSVDDIHYYGGPTVITEAALEASYNWISNDEQPKIFVPGCTPVWQKANHAKRTKVSRKATVALRPVHPTVPTLQSLLFTRPDAHTAAFDIIAEDRILLHLLRWSGLHSWTFKFQVDVLGSAVVFSRHSDTTFSSRKQAVLRARTHWLLAVSGSEAHHRVISYGLGNMRLLVHCECDGYLPQLAGSSNKSVPADAGMAEHVHDCTGPGLTAERYGRYINQKAIFDLSINSGSNAGPDKDTICPRLWVRQCSNVVSVNKANYRSTTVEPEVTDMTETVRQWEEENEDVLARYKVALRFIAMKAREHKDKRLEVVRRDDGPIELRTRSDDDGHKAIPSHLKERWLPGGDVTGMAATK